MPEEVSREIDVEVDEPAGGFGCGAEDWRESGSLGVMAFWVRERSELGVRECCLGSGSLNPASDMCEGGEVGRKSGPAKSSVLTGGGGWVGGG